MTNVDYLRGSVAVLTELADQIGGINDVAAELPNVDPRGVVGMQAAKALILERLRDAQRRLADQSAVDAELAELATVGRHPIVLDPYELPSIVSHQGQPLTPVITVPYVATEGISSADVWMPPGHASYAHVHYHTDIIVLVRDGEAITLWWDREGRMHELTQRAGQHLHIPAGVPHAAINLGQGPVSASEFRSNRVFDADNTRLPDLQSQVDERMRDVERPVAQ